MKAKIEIKMDNQAFEENMGGELARVLHDAANSVLDGTKHMLKGYSRNLRDINGNVVGQFKITSR